MGSSVAAGFAEMVENGAVGLRTAIDAHRVSNLYPAPPVYMLDVMVAAVEAVQEHESDILLALPEGVSWKGQDTVPAYDVIESFRLEAFI